MNEKTSELYTVMLSFMSINCMVVIDYDMNRVYFDRVLTSTSNTTAVYFFKQ